MVRGREAVLSDESNTRNRIVHTERRSLLRRPLLLMLRVLLLLVSAAGAVAGTAGGSVRRFNDCLRP